MSESVDDLVAQLQQLGYQVKLSESPPKPKPEACSVCGAIDENAYFSPNSYDLSDYADDLSDVELAEWLTPVKVEVGEQGEEGWDFKTLLFCPVHEGRVIEQLIGLGFGTHHHGSTHPLSDESCTYGCEKQGSPYDE